MLAEVIPSFGYAYWYATPENEWKEVIWKYLPNWLTVNDKEILRGYYEGDSSIYNLHTIRTWLSPVVAWSSFTFVMVFIMLCITVVLRRQWTESERLTYPTIRLPMEMTNPKSGFFRNRLMWMGFAVAGGICLINGLNVLYPSIPQIPVKRRSISHYFTTKPWNAMEGLHIGFYPFIRGLVYFVNAVGQTFVFASAGILACATIPNLQEVAEFARIREFGYIPEVLRLRLHRFYHGESLRLSHGEFLGLS
jgi:hypothetical protein